MTEHNKLHNSLLDSIVVSDAVPKGVVIMAPDWVLQKAARGEELTADDLRFCAKMEDTHG